jgi:O-antigen chain-terminating methyltransferase
MTSRGTGWQEQPETASEGWAQQEWPATKTTRRTAEFYHAFESRYRGSRDLIKQRLRVYLPFINPFKGIDDKIAAVDLGCGRGEWLELLKERGFQAQGVDLDPGMLAASRERGLPAIQRDAIQHLKSLPDQSQYLISGFHFAEHIALDALQTLIVEALRTLKPGGLLILETPNPENLVVGTMDFYLDPTHLRPIPPLLLSFLAEHHGFSRRKVMRLQEPKDAAHKLEVGVHNVLYEVSPDYAVVAQKGADVSITERFDSAFAQDYGLSLEQLSVRYDQHVTERFAALEQRLSRVEQAEARITDTLARLADLQDRFVAAVAEAAKAQAEVGELKGRLAEESSRVNVAEVKAALAADRAEEAAQFAQAAERRAQEVERLAGEETKRADWAEKQAQEHAERLEDMGHKAHHWWRQATELTSQRDALLQSWSWRLTEPLRCVARSLRLSANLATRGARVIVKALSRIVQRLLAGPLRVVLKNRNLAVHIDRRLVKHPRLHAYLLAAARRHGIIVRTSPQTSSADRTDRSRPALASFPPQTRRIYALLKTARRRQDTAIL